AGMPHACGQADMLVILNDNDMSISPPVGALNHHLARLMSGRFYAAARDTAKSVLKNAPPLFELARRFEEHAKGMVVPGTIFEEFGFNYVGPIYSTFLQRAYDQLIHDVAIQTLPVVFALDRAGLVGADGATHAGAYDIAYLRCIPNMSVLTPADENECRRALTTAFKQDHPTAVRYPRGSGAG